MTDPAVGQKVNVSFIPTPGGGKFVYVTPEGKYLGSVQFDSADAQSLGTIGELFGKFAAQQASQIQIAPGMPQGLLRPV